MTNPQINRAGMVCFNRAGQVLLLNGWLSDDIWVFPKGHIEKGEETYQTAEREVFEETGIRALTDAADPVGVTTFEHKGEQLVVEWWTGVANSFPEQGPWDESRWRGIKWVSWEEALELLAFSDLRNVLRAALCMPFSEEDEEV